MNHKKISECGVAFVQLWGMRKKSKMRKLIQKFKNCFEKGITTELQCNPICPRCNHSMPIDDANPEDKFVTCLVTICPNHKKKFTLPKATIYEK